MTTPWRPADDERLISHLLHEPVGAWSALARRMGRRSPDDVRLRVEQWLGAVEVERYTGVRVALQQTRDGTVTWAAQWPTEAPSVPDALDALRALRREREQLLHGVAGSEGRP